MRRFLVSVFVFVVSILVAAGGAEAQWRAERPYRGLFAGGLGETSQLLTATASAGTGWSQNLVLDPAGGRFLTGQTGREFRGGVYTGSGMLSYSLNLGPVALGAMAGTTGQYYSGNIRRFVRREYASIGTSVAVGGGFSVHAAASYQPYSLRSIFPGLYEPTLGDPTIVDEDFPSSRVHYLGYSAGVDYTRRISRRNSVFAGYNYQARRVSGETMQHERESVRGRFTHDVGRGLALYAGYGYSRARYRTTGLVFVNHDIDLGVNYNRALSLSLSRRTVLSFTTGTSLYQTVEPTRFRFRATGSARLTHEMGRTWSASASYYRGLSLVDTWIEPVFADSAAAGLGGLIGRRTSLQFSARALLGGGYSGRYGDAKSVSGSGALSVALTRHISTGLTYLYYRQQFAETLSVVEGFPNDFAGQSIRVSVSVWAPLFQRARRP